MQELCGLLIMDLLTVVGDRKFGGMGHSQTCHRDCLFGGEIVAKSLRRDVLIDRARRVLREEHLLLRLCVVQREVIIVTIVDFKCLTRVSDLMHGDLMG